MLVAKTVNSPVAPRSSVRTTLSSKICESYPSTASAVLADRPHENVLSDEPERPPVGQAREDRHEAHHGERRAEQRPLAVGEGLAARGVARHEVLEALVGQDPDVRHEDDAARERDEPEDHDD